MTTLVETNRSDIETDQLLQLNRLLRALVPDNRFYADRLREAEVVEGVSSFREFSERVPFTTKAELVEDQLANPPFGSNLTYPLERYSRYSQTSGTKGAPLRRLDTPEDWGWMLDNWVRILEAAGVGPEDRVYVAFSFGPFLGFWTAFEAAAKMGCLVIPGGGLSSCARLDTILEAEATVLVCTPTYAIHLGQVAREQYVESGQTPIRTLIVSGEPGGNVPGTRQHLEVCWKGARICDHHGMTEVGPVSFECPKKRGLLHIIESSYYAEVVDPETGDPVERGMVGELVLTTLGKAGAPVLRYRTGDLVKAVCVDPCECGRYEVGLIGGIIGRADDMVLIRGVNVYPSAVEDIVRRFEEVAEYQVEVYDSIPVTEIEVRAEPIPTCADPAKLQDRLQAAFKDRLNLRVPVHLAEPGSLPRFEMKAKRWVRY